MATIGEALAAAMDHMTAGRIDAACELCRRVLDIAPENPMAHHLTGLLTCRSGDHGAGVAALRRAVALSPGTGDFQVNLAKALLNIGAEDAVSALRHARRLSPLDGELAHHLGVLSAARGDVAVARSCWRDIAVIQPTLAEPWRHLAMLADRSDDGAAGRATARAMLRRVPILKHDDAAAYNALGGLARREGDQAAAIGHFRRALIREPANPAALSTLGNALKDSARLDEALIAHDRAVRTSGADPTMVWNLAQAALLAGDFETGWRSWEKRWWAKGFPTPRRHTDIPPWRGEEVASKTVLLYEEQGRGDTIQFCRHATAVAERGAEVVLEVGTDLVGLLSRLPGVHRVIVPGDAVPPVDFAAPLGGLPAVLGVSLASLPGPVPYLTPDPARVAAWRERMAEGRSSRAPRVGLIWAGNPDFAADRWRSPGLAALAPLLTLREARFFGLQLGPGRRDLEHVRVPPHFTDLAPDIRDFEDTAAIMANLDIVVSSCTASAHLAGALGRPVWVALSHVPDWRWLLGRNDSPWYPTARLFRQPTPGDWASVVRDLRAALAGWSADVPA